LFRPEAPAPPPLAHEHALRGAALVAGAGVHGAAPERGPPHDLHAARARVVHEAAVALEGGRRGVHHGYAHAGEARGKARMEIVDGRAGRPVAQFTLLIRSSVPGTRRG